jgi:hypothetical protein
MIWDVSSMCSVTNGLLVCVFDKNRIKCVNLLCNIIENLCQLQNLQRNKIFLLRQQTMSKLKI